MILALLLAVMVAASPRTPEPAPPPAEEMAAVIRRLGPVQMVSFATDREYCGYLLRGEDGVLSFTEMVRGGHDGCTPLLPMDGPEVVASVHTHGAYNPKVPAEFPTVLDMESDRREGVNGYIGTPGGRLWYIDSDAMVAMQLCPPGCLPQDPAFRPGDDGEIALRYGYRQLRALESGKN